MKEKTTYTCEKCGKLFDNKQICEEHENECEVCYLAIEGATNIPKCVFLDEKEALDYIDKDRFKNITMLHIVTIPIYNKKK